MKQLLLNGRRYLHLRSFPDRGEELLDLETLSLHYEKDLSNATPSSLEHRSLVPGSIPFLARPFSFITDLHSKRLAHLLEYRASTKRKTNPGGPSKAPGEKRVRKPKGLAGSEALAALLAFSMKGGNK